MSLLWIMLACEPMPDPGAPFAAVGIAERSAPAETAGTPVAPSASEEAAAEPSDPAFEEETFEIGSDELGAAPAGPSGEEPPPEAGKEAGSVQEEQSAEPEEEAESVSRAAPSSQESPVQGLGGWPVQVAAVMPDMDPPRAIIRLPDGTESVVKAGTMLPRAGLIVVSIGSRAVSLVKVLPEGDHARIESFELLAQN